MAPPTHHVCSVWDWDRLRYDYYRVPGKVSIGGWQPLTGLGMGGKGRGSGMGVDIEDALPRLPEGAVQVGSGREARGRVCVRRSHRALSGMESTLAPVLDYKVDWRSFALGAAGVFLVKKSIKLGMVAGLGYLGYKFYTMYNVES